MTLQIWLFPFAGSIAGAIFGSFIAALVIRWPRGQGVAHGRSRCDACGKALGAFELIPVFSHLIQRGRCRGCGAVIDARHLGVELAAAFVGAVALAVSPDYEGLFGALFGWFLLALAVLDIDQFWLPDRLTLPLMALGLVSAPLTDPANTNTRIIGAAAGSVGLSLIGWGYRRWRGREGLGGGDPKLLGAIGAWLGWVQLPFVLLLASLIGLMSVIARRLGGEAIAADTRVPFGALMAAAAWPLWLLGQA